MINVTLRQLRAFRAVGDLGSFTAASRVLNLTQSALSVLVRELERELGVRLFDRNTRRVSLTDAGNDFYPYADRMLQELESAVSSVGSLRDKKRGALRVAATQMIAFSLLPRAIAAYKARFPEISVKLVDTAPEALLPRVLGGDVEFAIGPDILVSSSEISRQPLIDYPLMLVCRRDHRLADQAQVTWSELQGEEFISPTRDFIQQLLPALGGLVLKPSYEVSYMSTALGLVAAGLGVSAIPQHSLSLANALNLTMRPLVEPVHERKLCIYRLPQKSLSSAGEAFIKMLVEASPAL